MNDLISRQAALDALTEYWKGISDRHPTLDGEMAVYADCKGIIKRLPSAQRVHHYSDLELKKKKIKSNHKQNKGENNEF